MSDKRNNLQLLFFDKMFSKTLTEETLISYTKAMFI